MTRLLHIEWIKLKNYRAFIIISIFFIVGVFATNYIVYSVFKNIISQASGGSGGILPSWSPYDFDRVWQSVSYATGFILILPALLLIIITTNEFTYKTNRQNIIDGLSRNEFINVKLMLALIVAFASTFLVVLTGLGFGFASGTSFGLENFSHVGFFFVKALTYNLIATFISVWIRRTGFAIGLYFIYLGAENIISQILDVLSIKMRNDMGNDLGSMGDYLPMNASDGLLTFPDNPIKHLAKSTLPTDYTWLVMCLAAFYIILFFHLSRRRILATDL